MSKKASDPGTSVPQPGRRHLEGSEPDDAASRNGKGGDSILCASRLRIAPVRSNALVAQKLQ